MSFDLSLFRFADGDGGRVDATAMAALRAVIARHCGDAPDQFGYVLVNFEDGSSVELNTSGLEDEYTSCNFHIRSFSPHVLSFVYDLARAGGLTVLNPQSGGTEDSPMALFVDDDQPRHAPDSLAPFAPVCHSAAELAAQLGAGFDRWSAYRDSVAPKPSE